MADTMKLAGEFALAAAALSAALSDNLKAKDPEAHAQLERAIREGHHVALCMVTSTCGGPRITLDLVAGPDTRLTVLTLNAKAPAAH